MLEQGFLRETWISKANTNERKYLNFVNNYVCMKGLAKLVSEVKKAKESVPSLNIGLFKENQAEMVIKKISKCKNDEKLLKKYKEGTLTCDFCDKPLTKEKNNLGAVIPTTSGDILFSCKDFKCYEKCVK